MPIMADVPTVTCVRCNKTFECFCDDQAHGCAANIVDGSIYGHYGSAVADLMLLTIDPKHLLLIPKNGVICDVCITALDEQGAFISQRMRDAFGATV